MKAIVAKSGSEAQEAGVFILEEQPLPEPGTQDLQVRVIAIGMNPVDTKVRQRSEKDGVLGWDTYGIVEKTGDGVTGFKAGENGKWKIKVFTYTPRLNRMLGKVLVEIK